MADSGKGKRLIVGMLSHTQRGVLRWHEGVDGVTFVTELGSHTLSVSELDGTAAGPDYVLDLATPDGKIVESLFSDASGGELRGPLRSLYEAARGSARGSEEVVDELLAALDAA